MAIGLDETPRGLHNELGWLCLDFEKNMKKIGCLRKEYFMANFEVRVVNNDQEPLRGVRVKLEFTSITRGMSAEEYTDSDGVAYFSNYDEGEIRVYVDHDNCGTHYYEDGEQITITK